VFQPDVYATIIAYTPFFTSPAQQVLVQGWQVTPQNLPQLLTILEKQLQELEDRVAEVSGIAQAQLDALRVFLQHSKFNIHESEMISSSLTGGFGETGRWSLRGEHAADHLREPDGQSGHRVHQHAEIRNAGAQTFARQQFGQ
jgi:hypothetical protein